MTDTNEPKPKAPHLPNMEAVALQLDCVFNEDPTDGNRDFGYVLMVFPFDITEFRCDYMSNADIESAIALMRSFIKNHEGGVTNV